MPPRRPRNRGRVSDDGRGLPGGRGTHDADEGETPEARVQSAFSREATKAHTCPLRLRAHGAHRVARGRSGAPSRSRRFASHTRPLELLDLLLADRRPPVQSFEGGADHDATDGATSGYGGKTWRFSGRTGGCPKLTAEGASHADEISRRTKMKPGTAAPGVSRQTGPSTLLCDGFGVRAAAAAADRSRPERASRRRTGSDHFFRVPELSLEPDGGYRKMATTEESLSERDRSGTDRDVLVRVVLLLSPWIALSVALAIQWR